MKNSSTNPPQPLFQLGPVSFHRFTRADAVRQLLDWSVHGDRCRSAYFVNVHSWTTAQEDPEALAALRGSDLNLADGNPIVWSSRLLGHPLPERIAGPDLFESFCQEAARREIPMFFLGSTPDTLERLTHSLVSRFPEVRIAGSYSPSFCESLSDEENQRIVDAINQSGARIVWVSMSAPKQEKWIQKCKPLLRCGVAAGIGAAFDFSAGTKHRAPKIVQHIGMEWLFRFLCEPARTWRRYLYSNISFTRHIFKIITRRNRYEK